MPSLRILNVAKANEEGFSTVTKKPGPSTYMEVSR